MNYEILSEPLLMYGQSAKALLPVVAQILKGKTTAKAIEPVRPMAYLPTADAFSGYWMEDAPEGSVVVHEVSGMIGKGYYYPIRTSLKYLAQKIQKAEDLENIVAHVFHINSGGGQATGLEPFVRWAMATVKKPLLVYVNGLCASAAYYLATVGDKIYASQNADLFGSIGVENTFTDYDKYYKDMGIKKVTIRADQSKLKNKVFDDIKAGKPQDYKDKVLNVYAEQFIGTAKELRPGIVDAEVFEGEIYATTEAIEKGLVDGIRTFEEVIGEAKAAGEALRDSQNQNVFSNQINYTMKFQKINAVLGVSLEADKDGGVYLNAEQLEALEASTVAADQEAVATTDLADIKAFMKDVNAKIDKVDQSVTAQNKSIEALEGKVEAYGEAPGAEATAPEADADPANTDGDLTPEAALKAKNEAFAKGAKTNSNPFLGAGM